MAVRTCGIVHAYARARKLGLNLLAVTFRDLEIDSFRSLVTFTSLPWTSDHLRSNTTSNLFVPDGRGAVGIAVGSIVGSRVDAFVGARLGTPVPL